VNRKAITATTSAPIAATAIQRAAGCERVEDAEELAGAAGAERGPVPPRGFFLLLIDGYDETRAMRYEGEPKNALAANCSGMKRSIASGRRSLPSLS
jgi:hypothetical protein